MDDQQTMVRVFDSFEEADRADREEYSSMTPDQALISSCNWSSNTMALHPDFKEF